MSDFFSSLAARALDVRPQVMPRTTPMFEPAPSPGGGGIGGAFADDALVPELDVEIDAPAARPGTPSPPRLALPLPTPAARGHEAEEDVAAPESRHPSEPSVFANRESAPWRPAHGRPQARDAETAHVGLEMEDVLAPSAPVSAKEPALHVEMAAHDVDTWPGEIVAERDHGTMGEAARAPQFFRPRTLRSATRSPAEHGRERTRASAAAASNDDSLPNEEAPVSAWEATPQQQGSVARGHAHATSQRPPIVSGAVEAETTISISIGRIDVRASAPVKAPAARSEDPPIMTLESYLQKRERRSRP